MNLFNIKENYPKIPEYLFLVFILTITFNRTFTNVILWGWFFTTLFIFYKNLKNINYLNLILISSFFYIYCFSFLLSENKMEAIKIITKSLPLVMIPIGFGIMKVSKKFILRLSYSFIISVVIFLIYMVYTGALYFYYYPEDFYFEYAQNKVPTFVEFHAPYLSVYIITALILNLTLHKINLYFRIFSSILLLLGLLFLSSRIPILSLFIIAFVYFLYNKKWITLLLFSILASLIFTLSYWYNPYFHTKISLLLESGFGLDYRVLSNKISWQLFLENPVIGYSIGDYKDVFLSSLKKANLTYYNEALNPHNTYTFFLLSTGILGFFSYMTYLGFNLKKAFNNKNNFHICFILLMLIVNLTEIYWLRQQGILLFVVFNALCVYFPTNWLYATKKISQKT